MANNIEAPFTLAASLILCSMLPPALYGDIVYVNANPGMYHRVVDMTYMKNLQAWVKNQSKVDGKLLDYTLVEARSISLWGYAGRISSTPKTNFWDPISSFSAFAFWFAGLGLIIMPWGLAVPRPPHLHFLAALMLILASVTAAFHEDASMGGASAPYA